MSVLSVSLVIPGRNCVDTLRECLTAVTSIREASNSALTEIIFVDDGSTDDTAAIAGKFSVTLITGGGVGPGAARNLGWRAAASPLIWFIDSDCVAEPDALKLLVTLLADPAIAGVGGSYANARPGSLLARLIHQEIVERHLRMPEQVRLLGGFNVLYRREILEQVGGFDEHRFNGPGSPGAEDAELSYRIHAKGDRLEFEPRSRVAHFHPTSLRRYLRSQRHHGYWRVFLHLDYPRIGSRDGYSGLIDHVQPPLAALAVASSPLLWSAHFFWLPVVLGFALLAAQLPMTTRLLLRLHRPQYLLMIPLGFVRAFARAAGMLLGLLAIVFQRQ